MAPVICCVEKAAPENVTVLVLGVKVPPEFVQLLVSEILPARFNVAPLLMVTLPKVMAAVGVTVAVVVVK